MLFSKIKIKSVIGQVLGIQLWSSDDFISSWLNLEWSRYLVVALLFIKFPSSLNSKLFALPDKAVIVWVGRKCLGQEERSMSGGAEVTLPTSSRTVFRKTFVPQLCFPAFWRWRPSLNMRIKWIVGCVYSVCLSSLLPSSPCRKGYLRNKSRT